MTRQNPLAGKRVLTVSPGQRISAARPIKCVMATICRENIIARIAAKAVGRAISKRVDVLDADQRHIGTTGAKADIRGAEQM